MEREACVCDHGFERSDLCAEIIIIIIIILTREAAQNHEIIVPDPASWAGWSLDVLVEKLTHTKKNRSHQVGIAIGDCCLDRIVEVKLWGPLV